MTEVRAEMPDDPSCCLSCAIKNVDYEKLKNWLDIHGLSESQALFLGHDLLCKAVKSSDDWFHNFVTKAGAETNSESKSKSETPLHWNGNPLCHAVGMDNIKIIKSLLQENYVVDEATSHDYLGLLHMAAQLDDTKIAQVLLDHLDQNETPPRCAIVMNNLKTVKLLLQASVDVNGSLSIHSIRMATQLATKRISEVFLNPLSFNKSLLYTAAEINNTDSIVSLLLKNANVEERSYNDLTPLHIAAQLGNTESAKILLDHGADTNSVCASALGTLLVAAVEDGDEALVKLLLRKGGNINTMTNYGSTLLHLAAERSHLEVIKLLLNNGFDIDAQDKYNKNILYHTIMMENFPVIEMIIEARFNSESPMGEIQSKISEDLLRYGFGANSNDNEWYLYKAVRSGCLKIVEHLINLGANVNTKWKDERDTAPLHLAVSLQHIEITKLLIKNHADVNVKDENGKTPIHYACDCEDWSYVYGDEESATPLCSIARSRIEEIIKILLNEGAMINSKEIDGKTALHFAVVRGNAGVIKLLIENGADVADRNNDGETALHIAAAGSSSEIVGILLNVFDDVDCRDRGGNTALHVAAKHKTVQIVRLLLDHNSDINLLPNSFDAYSQGYVLDRTRLYTDSDSSDDNTEHWLIRDQFTEWRVDCIEFTNRCAEEMALIFKHHIVKMIALNRYVSDKHLQALNRSGDYKVFHDQCKGEIEFMRQKKIGVSNVSYYDVLTKGTNQLALYVRNKDIVAGLEMEGDEHMFHLYSAMLHHRFKNGQKRADLLDSSVKSFRFLTGYDLPDLPTVELLHYLSNEDLKNLIKAAPCNERDN